MGVDGTVLYPDCGGGFSNPCIRVFMFTETYTFHPPPLQFYCMIIENRTRPNKTSGPIGRVLYFTPLTKRQKFHLALLLPSRLTHLFSHPHRELSVDETSPGSWNSGVNGKAVAFAFKEFMIGGRKPA